MVGLSRHRFFDMINKRVMSSDGNLIVLKTRTRAIDRYVPVKTVLAMTKDESTAKDCLKKSPNFILVQGGKGCVCYDSLDTKHLETIQDALRILEREDHRRQSKISTISGSVSIGKTLNF